MLCCHAVLYVFYVAHYSIPVCICVLCDETSRPHPIPSSSFLPSQASVWTSLASTTRPSTLSPRPRRCGVRERERELRTYWTNTQSWPTRIQTRSTTSSHNNNNNKHNKHKRKSSSNHNNNNSSCSRQEVARS